MIARRLLINFRVDPEVAQQHLPPGVQLKLHQGYGVAGICLIRFERMHPKFLPMAIGPSSENAAHRYAVTFDGKEGVYIPRRDSDSRLNQLLGGTLVPGVHHHAHFEVQDHHGRVSLSMDSDDGEANIEVAGTESVNFPTTSIFGSLEESSGFFEGGKLGLSDRARGSGYDQLELEIESWEVKPFDVESVSSSYFSDEVRFPAGSATFDHALIMRNAQHEWHTKPRFG